MKKLKYLIVGLTLLSTTSIATFSCVTSSTTTSNNTTSLTINQKEGGTVSVKGVIPTTEGVYSVKLNEPIEFVVTTEEGYELSKLTLNGADITDTLTYTATIKTNLVVDVEYTYIKYATISYDESVVGGSISFENYENHAEVSLNTEIFVNVVANTYYTLSSLTVNDIDITSTQSFIVNEAITYYVTATFTYSYSGEITDYSYLYDNETVFPNRGNQTVSIDDYYEPVRGLKGEELKQALHDIIDDHDSSNSYSNYTRAKFAVTDADPNNPSNIIRFYEGSADSSFLDGSDFSREHVWAKSHGDFEDVEPMHNDFHNLRPCHSQLNSERSNYDFGTVSHTFSNNIANNSWATSDMDGNYFDGEYFEPKDDFKGDVARIIFYMAVRYEGDSGEIDLEVSGDRDTSRYNTFTLSSATGQHGNFMDLYEWATSDIDPVSDAEVYRNNMIDQNYQHNRNPFIDHPEFIIMIYDKTYDGPGALYE